MLVPLLGVPIKREKVRVGCIYVLMTCVKGLFVGLLVFLILVLDTALVLGLAAIHN